MTAAGRTSNKPTLVDTDSAFDKRVEDITSNKLKIRTFSDVHESYLWHGGKGCCKAVLAKLQKHFQQIDCFLCTRTLQCVGVS